MVGRWQCLVQLAVLGLVQGTADAGGEQEGERGPVVVGALWGEAAEGLRVVRGKAGQVVGAEWEQGKAGQAVGAEREPGKAGQAVGAERGQGQ